MAGVTGVSTRAQLNFALDRWIGWDDAGCREHLRRAICLSRFPVRSNIRCPQLADHACLRCPRRLPHDSKAHNERRPFLVESVVAEVQDFFMPAAG